MRAASFGSAFDREGVDLTIRDYFIFPQKCMNVLYLSGADLGGGGEVEGFDGAP